MALIFLANVLSRFVISKIVLFEVIIIDNGSDDGSLEFIRENYPEFTLIENRDNLGFSVAVNQGIKAPADTDYVLLLNNDVVLEPDCIFNLLKCISNDIKFLQLLLR